MNELQRDQEPNRYFSWPQASEYCGLSESTLHRAEQQGRLVVMRIGNRTLIWRDDLDEFLLSLRRRKKSKS